MILTPISYIQIKYIAEEKERMGAWGSSLYSNDTACDVREVYMELLREQLTNEEAYQETLERFRDYIGDPDEEPLFWFALAETQWKVGRLTSDVKLKALSWIEKGGGITLWKENGNGGAGWQKTLDKLREKLETEQPKEKKVRKPTIINQNPWNMGDVYAYQFNTEESRTHKAYGKYMILQKMGEDPYSSEEDLVMRVHVFDKLFDEVPMLSDLEGVRLLPLGFPIFKDGSEKLKRELKMSRWLNLYKKRVPD